MDIGVQVEAKVYGVNAKNDLKFKEQQEEFSTNTTMKVFNDGGILETVPLDKFLDAWNTWKKEILEGRRPSSLCGFDRFNEIETMFPLWEIAKLFNPAKANAIKAEFDRRYAACGVKIDGMTQYVKNVYITSGKGTDVLTNLDAIANGEPIFKTHKNLNHGHGHQVHLAYSLTTKKDQAITDIRCVSAPYATGVGQYRHNEPKTRVDKRGITYTEFAMSDQPGIVYYVARDPNAGAPIQDIFVEVESNVAGRAGDAGWTRVEWLTGGWANTNNWKNQPVYIWIRR